MNGEERRIYFKNYIKSEKQKIFYALGNSCSRCGTQNQLEIHHKIPLGHNRPIGTPNRLTEWKKNLWNLQLLCKSCHKHIHDTTL